VATALRIAIPILVGYLVGGVPFGVVIARRCYGADITAMGSGNTGATNVLRNLGWQPALVVALLDIAKGAAAAGVALGFAAGWSRWATDLLVVAAGVSAMAGHMYSPYFRLRGGKGIATAAGAIFVLMPAAFPLLIAVFAVLVLVFRIVSVASILAALCFPVAIWVLYPDRPVLFVFALLGVPLVVWRHRANLVRLVRGEEPKIRIGRPGGRRNASGAGEGD